MITIYSIRKMPGGQQLYLAESRHAKNNFVKKHGPCSVNEHQFADGRDVVRFVAMLTNALEA